MTHPNDFPAAADTPTAAGTAPGNRTSGASQPRRRNRSGAIGTKAETAVVRCLRANGFPQAERRRLRGAKDAGDITGTPGVVWSVKGGHAAEDASDAQIQTWLDEADTQRANADEDLLVLVVKRRGIGLDNAAYWWAIQPVGQFYDSGVSLSPLRLHLIDALVVLRENGYGQPLDVLEVTE